MFFLLFFAEISNSDHKEVKRKSSQRKCRQGKHGLLFAFSVKPTESPSSAASSSSGPDVLGSAYVFHPTSR